MALGQFLLFLQCLLLPAAELAKYLMFCGWTALIGVTDSSAKHFDHGRTALREDDNRKDSAFTNSTGVNVGSTRWYADCWETADIPEDFKWDLQRAGSVCCWSNCIPAVQKQIHL